MFDELFYLKMNQYDDAEEALTEANFLNNQNAGKELFRKKIHFLFELIEVWAYLTLICLQTKRNIEAEQSYKYAIKVRKKSKNHAETFFFNNLA